MFGEVRLDFGDGIVPVMDHRGDQRGVGCALGDGFQTVLRRARAAGGDDGNTDALATARVSSRS